MNALQPMVNTASTRAVGKAMELVVSSTSTRAGHKDYGVVGKYWEYMSCSGGK